MLKKILLAMNLTIALLTVAFLNIYATGVSQNVSFSGRNVPLESVFSSIEKQTDFLFMYVAPMLKSSKRVTVNAKNIPLEQFLSEIFRSQPLEYTIKGKSIFVGPKTISTGQSLKTFNFTGDTLIKVNGKVLDNLGVPLEGATVNETGTSNTSVTKEGGLFSMSISKPGASLLISFIGYINREIKIPVDKTEEIIITLQPSPQSMNDVVVVGYGSQRKRDLASSTSRVTAEEFKTAIINTPDQALQGRAAGVQVVQSSGEPGAQAIVRIRGNNSLSGNNEPLYVIDGFPMPPYVEASANAYGTFQQNGLYGVNPNDIESIEVLKDASATAIYGSRGANGVILITTKSGKKGEGKIELLNRTTTGRVNKEIDMMNGPEYAEMVNELYQLRGSAAPFTDVNAVTNTDWFGAVSRPSMRQENAISISGGTPKSSYYISANYLLDKGILSGSDNKRGSLRVNLNNEVTSWYTLKTQLTATRQLSNRAISSSLGWPLEAGSFLDALRASPTVALDYAGVNIAGIPGYSSVYRFSNPYTELNSKVDQSKSDFTVVNLENWLTIINDLKLVVTLGGNQNLSRRQLFYPPNTAKGFPTNGTGSSTMANTYSYNANAYFVYDKLIGSIHKLNATAGVESNKQVVELLNTTSSGFDIPIFGVNNIGSAQTQGIGSYKEERLIQSAFFRGNYSFNGKYVLNASLRLDGASPFAENKKLGLFPAVAAAWNISEEEFLRDVPAITNAKIRASYGETGSQAIAPYSSLARYGNAFYQIGNPSTIVTSLFPSTLGNSNLTWERTRQFNAGMDISLFNNKLGVAFDYYVKRTDDLLQNRTLPSQSGFGSIIDNYGSMQNKGIEISIQYDIIKRKDLEFNARLNISKNKNILLNLGDKTTPDYVSIGGNLLGGVSGILEPGKEVGRFFGYKVVGLAQENDFNNGIPTYPYEGPEAYQVPGTWKYQDNDKNGTIGPDDRMVLGKSTPDFTYGIAGDIRWKNLGVNLFFTGSQGNDLLNVTRFYLNNGLIDYANVINNQTKEWYVKHYSAANQHNDPRFPAVQTNMSLTDINSSMIEDGSYFRLKTLTISYMFPTFKFIKNLQLFAVGTNLFTITKYTGFDPEVSSFNQSLLQQGIDFGAYPGTRTYTFGISCNF